MSKEIRQPEHGEILGQLWEQAKLEITCNSPDQLPIKFASPAACRS